MPRYHFDIFDGRRAIDDGVGDDFVDLPEAMDQAVGLLMGAAQEAVVRDRSGDLGVIVRDDRGTDLYWAALMFREGRVDPARSRHLLVAPPTREALDAAALTRRAMQIQAGADEAWRQFLETLADVSRTLQDMRAMAGSGGATTLPR